MNVTLRMYVDVKSVLTIAASIDLHAMGGRLLFEGYSRRATKQRGHLFEEIRYMHNK